MDDTLLKKIVEDQGRRIEALEERIRRIDQFIHERGWLKGGIDD